MYVMREVSPDALWSRNEKYLKVGFWGLNLGLALQVVLSLFPGGLLQVWDVLQNGYWHARSIDYLGGELPRLLEWLRIVGDMVFIFAGVLPIAIALLLSYLGFQRGHAVRAEQRLAH